MISAHWLEKRQNHWSRLETLLNEVQKQGLRSLSRQELQQMGLLYRQAAADLSALREDPSGRSYARTLNLLLARAHNIIYTGRKSSAGGIMQFFGVEYPRLFRRNARVIGAAFFLFLGGSIAGALLTLTRPGFMRLYISPHMMQSIDQHKMWTDSVVSIKPAASSFIMTNNITVAFVTFAWGITAGLGTILSLINNGVMLGVIGAACWLNGMSLSLWSFVAGHGVLELPAIFIAGGGGLKIAQGMLFPGLLSRRDSLVKAGGEAVRLVVGTIPVLIIAGCIEGFISPSPNIPWQAKFTLAGVIGMVFYAYLCLAGRDSSATDAATK